MRNARGIAAGTLVRSGMALNLWRTRDSSPTNRSSGLVRQGQLCLVVQVLADTDGTLQALALSGAGELGWTHFLSAFSTFSVA